MELGGIGLLDSGEDFKGRVAVVTGGGSGIGRGIAHRLGAAGVRVVIGDMDGERAEGVAAEVPGAAAAQVDVSREADAQRLVQTALDRFGRLDFLVNCAGNAHIGPVVEMPFSAWQSLLDVHLTGTFLCCRAALDPIMEAGGAIVSLSSNYGFKGRVNGSHYSAAKAGIVALTKVLSAEMAPRGRANAIAPGPIDTPRWRAGLSDEEYAEKKARRVKDVPLGRMGRPEDIAEATLFLLGPSSSWITGQVLHVNGGEFTP